ncbi:unnamed protein product, partial [Prorocentrum cordatum]
ARSSPFPRPPPRACPSFRAPPARRGARTCAMTPRPGKIEVPISGEVISRRKVDRKARGDDDEVTNDFSKVVRMDGPSKLNWLCKALPMVRRRRMPPAEFLEIVTNQRFAANLDDFMPWGGQMV